MRPSIAERRLVLFCALRRAAAFTTARGPEPGARRGAVGNSHLDLRPDAAPLGALPSRPSTRPTFDEFVKFARAKSENLVYATAGPATTPHLVMLNVLNAIGATGLAVPLQGEGPQTQALLNRHGDGDHPDQFEELLWCTTSTSHHRARRRRDRRRRA